MKPNINWLYLFAVPFMLLLHACEDLPILEDCLVDTNIIIEPNDVCVVPCMRTFRLRNVENLPVGVRYNWTLTHNALPVILDDPSAAEVSVELTEGGNYLVSVALTFDFAGCDTSLDEPFAVGVDLPTAVITVDRDNCIVGDCEIVFSYDNENGIADSWTWTFPNDPNDYRNQNEVSYSFNEFPDTFQVVLTAENLGGSDTDIVTIIVRPETFILESNGGQDLSSVWCIKENANGGFSAIGNNKKKSYSLRISRSGNIDLSTLVFINELPAVYAERTALGCRQIEDTYVAYGNALRGSNQDAYLAAFNENFVPEAEVTHFSANDGDENLGDVTAAIGGGYIACGSNTADAPVGMLFLQLDGSFELQSRQMHFTESFFNRAVGILNMGDHYVVSGVANNGGNIEGVHFKLSPNLDLIENSVTFLGSSFTPTSMLKIDNENFILIGENGNTAIIKLIGDNMNEKSIGNTTFNQAMITGNNQLALAGYSGNNASRKPLLTVLDLPELDNNLIVNEPYPVLGGQFFCISQTADDGFVLGGTIEGSGGDQLLVIRTDRLGNIQ